MQGKVLCVPKTTLIEGIDYLLCMFTNALGFQIVSAYYHIILTNYHGKLRGFFPLQSQAVRRNFNSGWSYDFSRPSDYRILDNPHSINFSHISLSPPSSISSITGPAVTVLNDPLNKVLSAGSGSLLRFVYLGLEDFIRP